MKTKPHSFSKGIFERMSLQERINFARHLSIVIKSGIPLYDGLQIIQKQVLKKTLKKVIDGLILDVNNGQSLSDALARHRHLFGDFFISIVRIGEESGTLAPNLLYLAEELKKAKTLRSKVRSAMVYPLVILVATLGIISMLMFFVFPKVLPVFTGLGVELPATTKALIAIVEFFQSYWLYAIGGFLLFIIVTRLLLALQDVRYFFHRLYFYTPVLRTVTVDVGMANFTRVLGILLKSGVKIVEAIIVTSDTFHNLVYRRAFREAAEGIRRGEQFAHYLIRRKNIFPPLLAGLIEIGENTGNLEENLGYLAEYYNDEIEVSLRNLTSLLEPLMLLVMGLVVGFVALSIITPIYSITQGFQK